MDVDVKGMPNHKGKAAKSAKYAPAITGAAAPVAQATQSSSGPNKSKIGSPLSWGFKPADDDKTTSTLICGSCGAVNQLELSEPVRCRQCGHRVMLKKRMRRCLVFLAR